MEILHQIGDFFLFLHKKSGIMNQEAKSTFKISWPVKVLLLVAMMLLALFTVALIVALVFGFNNTGLATQTVTMVLQNVVVFIVPVILLATRVKQVEGKPVAATMWLRRGPSLRSLALVVIVYLMALPAMNYIVDWNESIKLPATLHVLEEQLRAMEDQAQLVTQAMLNTNSWLMMLVMVLVVGVLTGMGEETFFRAGLLGSMSDGKVNRHVAVWTVALIFSAFHMQFFGFVPRMLLGAWFGYLMLWSGEVWTPMIAHALNNSAVVVATFLANNHCINNNYLETLGVPQQGETPWLAIASAVATAIVIGIFMRNNKNNKS